MASKASLDQTVLNEVYRVIVGKLDHLISFSILIAERMLCPQMTHMTKALSGRDLWNYGS
jgi:hypothetical protein